MVYGVEEYQDQEIGRGWEGFTPAAMPELNMSNVGNCFKLGKLNKTACRLHGLYM